MDPRLQPGYHRPPDQVTPQLYLASQLNQYPYQPNLVQPLPRSLSIPSYVAPHRQFQQRRVYPTPISDQRSFIPPSRDPGFQEWHRLPLHEPQSHYQQLQPSYPQQQPRPGYGQSQQPQLWPQPQLRQQRSRQSQPREQRPLEDCRQDMRTFYGYQNGFSPAFEEYMHAKEKRLLEPPQRQAPKKPRKLSAWN